MKIKVCGLKYRDNMLEVISCHPAYMGFIFYNESPRNMQDTLGKDDLCLVPADIHKVGVFVNETLERVISITSQFGIDFVQLHGDESAEYCDVLSQTGLEVIKAFQVGSDMDFRVTEAYAKSCRYYLFDTKTKHYGGSGQRFDWSVLSQYHNEIPFFLSGGIDLDNVDEIKNLEKLNIHAIDINSKFEHSPGLKDIEKIRKLTEKIY